ncbi:MAG: DUF2236 domain-containing protein [Chloroflexi bacterium]|nr:DUF2236 domain-containing protein [Chloroflexota bacterium]MYD49096.1 DUF2236 domain-containing protein [Chloroflexota bacterium]
MLQVPTEYVPGYAKAREVDPERADRYIAHTMIGDPLADRAVASFADITQREMHQLIAAGMNRDENVFRDAPQELRDLFNASENTPDWFYDHPVYPGCRLFHSSPDRFLTAFAAGAIVQGFTTRISKSFTTTGRILDRGVHRLAQNIKHLYEIMIPEGLERDGEGWKLSVRIRLIHGQMRQLFAKSGQWDTEAYGVPLHAAHIGLASALFSEQLMAHTRRLGVRMTTEERASFMHIWRCSAWLMGVPETILFDSESDAAELGRIGLLCEPPPDVDAIIVGNVIINSAALVAHVLEPAERQALTNQGYRISRAFIGNELADQLEFPKQRSFYILPALRLERQVNKVIDQLLPARAATRKAQALDSLLNAATPDDSAVGISYRLPVTIGDDPSKPW